VINEIGVQLVEHWSEKRTGSWHRNLFRHRLISDTDFGSKQCSDIDWWSCARE